MKSKVKRLYLKLEHDRKFFLYELHWIKMVRHWISCILSVITPSQAIHPYQGSGISESHKNQPHRGHWKCDFAPPELSAIIFPSIHTFASLLNPFDFFPVRRIHLLVCLADFLSAWQYKSGLQAEGGNTGHPQSKCWEGPSGEDWRRDVTPGSMRIEG